MLSFYNFCQENQIPHMRTNRNELIIYLKQKIIENSLEIWADKIYRKEYKWYEEFLANFTHKLSRKINGVNFDGKLKIKFSFWKGFGIK